MTRNENDGYNGWTNYETWLVKLWIDNDQGSQEHWLEAARGCAEDAAADAPWTKAERARFTLADELKDAYEDAAFDQVGTQGVFTDLLTGALGRVEWAEIAASLLEEFEDILSPEEGTE